MNPAIAAQPPSAIRALNARKRPSSIDLGLGEPTLAPTVAHFERATEWVRANGCRYSPNPGDPDLREAIARHYRYPELDRGANVCVTTGSQEAVYAAIKATLDPAHDELLLVEPAFPVYAKIAAVEGIALRRVGLSAAADFAFDPDAILAAIGPRTRMIVICSPCNPTGRVVPKAAVETIARELASRPGPPILVLHDEIYRELQFVDDVGNFGDVYPYTISVNSLSKSNALTGLRLGWAIAPSAAMPEIVKLHGWLTSCASTFAQRVALEIFAAGDLAVSRPWYRTQRNAAVAAAVDSGLHHVAPDGTFYLWLDTKAGDSVRFASELIEQRDVVAVPGTIFGDDPALDGWLRASFVAPIDVVREGIARIAAQANEPVRTA
ncbi:MAG: pyridoxal phosphate-dependent aminotransferase [Vulcanimicrobiaceae bacterium]